MSTAQVPDPVISGSAGKATRQRGKERLDNILKAGQSILISEGHASLSLRRIADQLGISNGNVTYYFPNKDALLRALIEDMLITYDREFQEEAERFPDDPESRFRAYVDYLIADCKQADLRGFFYQLWSLATHNDVASELREKVYEHFMRQVLTVLEPLNPELEQGILRCNALTLMTLVEGLHIVYGCSETLLASVNGFDASIRRQAQLIATNTRAG